MDIKIDKLTETFRISTARDDKQETLISVEGFVSHATGKYCIRPWADDRGSFSFENQTPGCSAHQIGPLIKAAAEECEKLLSVNKAAAKAVTEPATKDRPRRICSKCGGSGSFMYSNTATYRAKPGTVAGQAFTEDVCNLCWGSGDMNNPGINLLED